MLKYKLLFISYKEEEMMFNKKGEIVTSKNVIVIALVVIALVGFVIFDEYTGKLWFLDKITQGRSSDTSTTLAGTSPQEGTQKVQQTAKAACEAVDRKEATAGDLQQCCAKEPERDECKEDLVKLNRIQELYDQNQISRYGKQTTDLYITPISEISAGVIDLIVGNNNFNTDTTEIIKFNDLLYGKNKFYVIVVSRNDVYTDIYDPNTKRYTVIESSSNPWDYRYPNTGEWAFFFDELGREDTGNIFLDVSETEQFLNYLEDYYGPGAGLGSDFGYIEVHMGEDLSSPFYVSSYYKREGDSYVNYDTYDFELYKGQTKKKQKK